MEKERRKPAGENARTMKREINAAQTITLVNLERFGWELKFIRHPLFQQPVAVVFDSDRKHYAILEPDGTLNEKPDFDIRK